MKDILAKDTTEVAVVDVVELLLIEPKNYLELHMQMYSHIQVHKLILRFHACLKPGDKILGFDLSHGGHLTHGSPVNFSGRLYTLFLWCRSRNRTLDYDKIQEIAIKEQQNYHCRASAYSRDMDFERFRVIADRLVLFY
jgi:glycine hydroxymethyltransferase